MQKLSEVTLRVRQLRRRQLGLALSAGLVLAACGGDSSTPELSQEELVADRNELRALVEETAVFTKCEMNESTGLPDVEVELANPRDTAWDFESITIGVSINDEQGFFLADADAIFMPMAPGETAKVTTSPTEFPDDGEIGECVVFDVVISGREGA